MKTYVEVAEKAKLDKEQTRRFLSYMFERWAETETDKCLDGYADEWAWRFKHGIEYEKSDCIGQAILDNLTT